MISREPRGTQIFKKAPGSVDVPDILKDCGIEDLRKNPWKDGTDFIGDWFTLKL